MSLNRSNQKYQTSADTCCHPGENDHLNTTAMCGLSAKR